jgi:aminoglycoside phosphotransferase (APT) family kinase protein
MGDVAPPLSLIGPGDGDGVRAFVRQHTSLRAGTAEALGAGMGSVAWLIDGDWVARFPITADARATLQTELALLALLHDALPVPVPGIEHVARNPEGEAIMTAYRLLDGVPLSLPALAALSDSARARAFNELSGMIDALRRVPVEHAQGAGVHVRRHEGFGHPSQRELHHRHSARVGDKAVTRIEELWRAYETGADEAATPDTLVHADLKPEHVLHDPNSGEITGVLDWGDACLSHADFELAVIGLFFDANVRDEVARRLPNVNEQQVAQHAELLVAVRWLCDLDVGAIDGDDPFVSMCAASLRRHLDTRA